MALVYSKVMRIVFLFLLFILLSPVGAGVYKLVDENGKVTYSDHPQEGAEEIKIRSVISFKPVKTDASYKSNAGKSKQEDSYTSIAITQPKLNETIRNNVGDVTVNISLQPGLKAGDKLSLFMDGKVVMENLRQTLIMLKKVERGSHTLQTRVYDGDGNVIISSSSVIFHLHRHHLTITQAHKPIN